MTDRKPNTKIRVMVVDDSAFMRTALSRMIESDDELEVVACAIDGKHAIEIVDQVNPDVVTMDIEMPRMNGLEALKRIMSTAPRPVIMISSLTQEGAMMTFEALDCGAFDYIPKQLSYVSLDIVKIRQDLVTKIKAAATHRRTLGEKRSIASIAYKLPATRSASATGVFPIPSAICIGTSTGGPKALQQILPLLPPDLPTGIVIVQHMPPGFTGPFAARLNRLCQIKVKEAEQDDFVEAGLVLIAPAGWHASLYRRTHSRYAIKLSKTPAGTLHIPSVDVLMLSAAEVLRSLAMGVILTGMGNDGEAGIKAIHDAGGQTIGQDEATCIVYGMPRACALAGTLTKVSPLLKIPEEIVAAARPCRV
jgi:two-component system chemotaxis response regulator CheB